MKLKNIESKIIIKNKIKTIWKIMPYSKEALCNYMILKRDIIV